MNPSEGPTLSQFEDADGFTSTSTSTSEADLRAQMGQSETPDPDPASDDADGPSPRQDPKEQANAADPQADDDLADPKAKAAPVPPTPKKGSPEGRVAEIRAQINAATREKHTVLGETAAAKAERAAIQAEIDAAKKELETLKAGKPAEKPAEAAAEKPAEGGNPEPQEDDFDDFRQFLTAHSKWTRDEAKRVAEETIKAGKQQAEETDKQTRERVEREERERQQAAVVDAHTKRIQKFSEENPNFVEVMKTAGDLPTNNAIDQHILHSEDGPALMQYLAENPEEAERLAPLGWGPTLVELGKIVATKLGTANTGSVPQRQSVTRTKPPISPVRGSAAVADDDASDDLDDLPIDQYVEKKNAQERAKRKKAS
jgi:hypothetical protein